MSDEIFDVVNENDEVVGRETRSRVHQQGLRHRAVHILVFNSAGQLFLQKRSMTKDTFPGVWDSSASGHLASGEDYDSGAIRELKEEIGVSLVRPPERLFKITACLETGQEHVWVYRCQWDGPLSLDPQEIEGGGWFAPETITRWISERPHEFASAFPRIWKALPSVSA